MLLIYLIYRCKFDVNAAILFFLLQEVITLTLDLLKVNEVHVIPYDSCLLQIIIANA